ncbi:hypothetical protein SBDP1_310011 [Syntrophobacter sp. SbD1]|nr:hypothetical protein SBDP1_310011 [Syntrophobacter sp. SbD1]
MLSDIAGQKRAVRFLKQLLKKDAVPHAFLFTGMAGARNGGRRKVFCRKRVRECSELSLPARS